MSVVRATAGGIPDLHPQFSRDVGALPLCSNRSISPEKARAASAFAALLDDCRIACFLEHRTQVRVTAFSAAEPFMSRRGVEFDVFDVENDPDAMKLRCAFGPVNRAGG
jgi:hypothetical protein